MENIQTLEDCILYLVNHKTLESFPLEKPDYSLFFSMAKQISKNIGLTINQKNLLIKKINEKYSNSFDFSHDQLQTAINTTKMPLRDISHVNRISVVNVDNDNDPYSRFFSKKYIKVEFSFNKKYLNKVKKIASDFSKYSGFGIRIHHHPHGSKNHYFYFENRLIHRLVSDFKNTKLEIDPELINIYNIVEQIIENKKKYISVIESNGNISISEYDKKYVTDISNNNLLIADLHRRHGIKMMNNAKPSSLVEQLAYRKQKSVFANSEKFSVYELLDCINTLDRYPLLVIFDNAKAGDMIVDFHQSISNFVDPREQSVLFRLAGKNLFNSYVNEKKLNNFVDKNTKIVYINNKTLPKVLLNTDWKPKTCFQYTSFVKNNIECYADIHSDMKIIFEKELSPFTKYKLKYEELQINNTRRSKHKS